MSDSTIQAISPGIASAVTQTVAAPLLYTFAALCQLCSALLVGRIRLAGSPARPRAERNFRREIVDGLRLLFGHPLLRLLLSQAALINLGAGIFLSMLPLCLLDRIGVAPWVFGLLSSVGVVAGWPRHWRARRRAAVGEIRMTVLFAALAPIAVRPAPLAVFPSAAVALVGVAEVLIAFVIIGRSVAAAGPRARVTSIGSLGRVSAANSVVTQGATPLGGLLAGVVANVWAIPVALWLGVLAMSGAIVVLVISPLRSQRTLPPEWERN